MKNMRVIALMLSAMSFIASSAQPSLSYQKHALSNSNDNPMSFCSYMDPGSGGENVTWDFSDLTFEKSFTGHLSGPQAGTASDMFDNINTVLEEFNAKFFFNIQEDRMEQYGYASADGKAVTLYDVPFVKIKFPFSYNDDFTGSFSGETTYSGTVNGTVAGTYEVVADAYGTLTVPGSVSYENTLRVKSTKTYTTTRSNSVEEAEIVTYRWYNNSHRYPLLVLTEYTVQTGGNESKNYQAAYNNNVVAHLNPAVAGSIKIYPNPASAKMIMEYTAVAPGTLYFSIIDNAGKIIRSFEYEVTMSGKQLIDISAHISGLKSSSYFLHINNGNEVIKKNFVKFD